MPCDDCNFGVLRFEWLANGLTNNLSQVTIKAETECIVVSWDYGEMTLD